MKDTPISSPNGDAVAKPPPNGPRPNGPRPTRPRPTGITAELVQERVTDAIRAQVGRGKEFSRDAVATTAGLDISTLGSWLNEEATPPVWKVLRLAATLGPDFVNRLLALAGMTGADWIDPQSASMLGVHAAAAELSAEVATALEDGEIDSAELARIDQRIGVLHERAAHYMAGRQRATIPSRLLRVVRERPS
jgi:hypothetical protein